ncbi:MAG: glycosyltransferase family 4 protein [Chitinophagales bacterium]|nr:glycosyltransferase family 4 protein [Chitinophagales bacterium]
MDKIKVGFVTARIDRNPHSGPNIYFRNLISQIHLNHSDIIELVLFRSKEKKDLLDLDVEQYEIATGESAAYRQLPKLIKTSGIDILHMNLLPVYNLFFYRYPCKKAVTLHGDLAFTEPQLAKRRMKIRMGYGFRVIDRLGLINKIDRFFPVSNSVFKELSKRIRIDAEKVRVTYNGMNKELFVSEAEGDDAVLKEQGVKPGYILHINNFSKKKNAGTLLKSFTEYKKVDPSAFLLIIGRNWDNEMVKEIFNSSSLKEGIDFKLIHGMPNHKLPPFYRSAKIFLNPTLHETFGITNLEAMACGTPVVSTNKYSVPEVVSNCGLLIDDPYDYKAFAEAISKLMQDQDEYDELRQKGIQRAKLFSWEKTAAETVEGYISLFKV